MSIFDVVKSFELGNNRDFIFIEDSHNTMSCKYKGYTREAGLFGAGNTIDEVLESIARQADSLAKEIRSKKSES